ncbi:Gag-pro-like protein [Gossypium australe]|uniref:Gag-pro-like protein n=1 Tax=Gossypium australe TaxID=47621 RepID=A0A5B6W7S3_9ROSI|nr:Gag-pro-like protein [Gossypium australe]
MGSGSNPEDNSTNPVVPDLDNIVEIDRARVEDQCNWMEEKFRAMESADYLCGVDAKELSLVPELVLPPKFKTPEFKNYNRTSCLEAHITMFYRRTMGSLIGSTTKWYNQLSSAKINSWKDLTQAFMKQYSHVTDMTPGRITL